MSGNVPLLIAWRYLFGRKSHSAVSAIAAVAVAGVAVATAAMICVMAVFNGFHHMLTVRMDRMTPDVMVTPAHGKMISDGDSLALALAKVEGVALATPTLSENALVICNGRETPVLLKGVVPGEFRKITALDSLMLGNGTPLIAADREDPFLTDDDGYPVDFETPPANASLSIGAASRTGVTRTGEVLTLFAPKRTGRMNPANPLNSFVVDSLLATSVYESEQRDFDDNMIITDISTVRNLFMYDTEASAVEVAAGHGTDAADLAGRIARTVGPGYVVRDRERMHEISFRMVNVEKWMSFLLLAFILVIASFNIISTVSMIVIDKQQAMRTMRSLGMTRRSVGRVFAWESALVTSLGAVCGILLGCALCLAQEKWGVIQLGSDPSQLMARAYPVDLRPLDIAAALVPVTAIGAVCAAVSAAFARSRMASDVKK